MWATHGTEVSGLGAFLGKGLVVILAGLVGIEREVELIVPAKLEAGLGEGVVALLGGGMSLGQVGGVGREMDVVTEQLAFTLHFKAKKVK